MPVRRVTTGFTYTSAKTVDAGRIVKRITLTVLNASIYAQFRLTPMGNYNVNSANWEETEQPLIPGVWNFSADDFGDGQVALVGVRVRSEVSTAPAIVTINA